MTARTHASKPSAPRRYRATLRPGPAGAPVPADLVELRERRAGGWRGRARFIPRLSAGRGVARSRASATAFDTALHAGLVPGVPVAIRLAVETPGAAAAPALARTWPSVITGVNADVGTGISEVAFRDPLSFLARRPIWGAYRDCSPGEMLGGAMSLAAGGDGRPTLTPALPGMPVVRICQYLRAALERVPYAIAAGQALEPWLAGVLGPLGVRIEMLGYPGGQVAIALRDAAPAGAPLEMTLDAGEASAANAAVIASGSYPGRAASATLIDDPALPAAPPVGGPGAVGTVSCIAHVGPPQSELMAGFAQDRIDLGRSRILVKTRRTGFMPGRLVRFTNRGVGGEALWQAGGTTHFFSTGRLAARNPSAVTGGVYANHVVLESGRLPWRPPAPPDDTPVIVSGIVDDGSAGADTALDRDRLGRIPIRFCFLPAGGPETRRPVDAASGGGAPGAWPPRIALFVIEPMAGDVHGFVGNHRRGDICRILVRNPMCAEILGFGRYDHQPIARDMTGISTGVIVRSGNRDRWSGLLFSPGQDQAPAQAPPRAEDDREHARHQPSDGRRPMPGGP